ncbi:TPA: hypothetical protein PI565_002820 [Staphylococcus aureus]|nr:hypothetical protein [Staphylococcus aureus]
MKDVFYIELREYLGASNIILKWISLVGFPLIGLIMSQLITRNTVMNPNKEKISRLFKNIFRFILLVIVLDILLFLSVSEIFGEVKDINTLKKDIWKSLYIFTAFNMIYAIVLFPVFIKEKKYYEVEIAHYNNETKRYVVLDRIKEDDDEILIYYDEHKNKEYEENISYIKEKEGRVTFIPHMISIFNINKNVIKETSVFPIWLRVLLILILLGVSIYIAIVGGNSLYQLWTTNLNKPFISFKIFLSGLPILAVFELLTISIFLYQTWLGKSRLEYTKRK